MRLNRYEIVGREHLEAAIASDQPVYVGFWHGRLLFAAWFLRNFNPTTLVSRSDDGELISGVLKRWGFSTIRGSSRRGARAAIRSMLQAMDDPTLLLAVTMDGPLGPYHKPAPGSLAAAIRKNAIVLPFSGSASRRWVFDKSWDRFMLPKPFGKVVITIGEPLPIDSEADESIMIARMAETASILEEVADALAVTVE